LKIIYFCMVKYLNFHNSSFAFIRYFFYCKWQGHGMTHPLFVCLLDLWRGSWNIMGSLDDYLILFDFSEGANFEHHWPIFFQLTHKKWFKKKN
jgi:hypothetical protein